MAVLGRALRRRGYGVVNLGYPSRRFPIEELSFQLADQLADRFAGLRPGGPVHFVTHSLGGILVRHFLATRPFPDLGRVVMLCPPNQGSELAERLRPYPLFRLGLGPAGRQLGTGGDSVPIRLGPVGFELGVITGTRSLNPLSPRIFEGPNDGKVAVARARVAGMTDFLVVPATHTFLMNRPDVIAAVDRFLRSGRFASPTRHAHPAANVATGTPADESARIFR